MLALTYRTETAGGPVLVDPLTGERYDFDEAELPDSLKEFLLAMAWEPPAPIPPEPARES
ncbi:MAG TPA: hypothetical protein VGK50_04950 [Coriobacteriia bacterium]